MNISIYGAGYVGLVSGSCLADLGHNVLVMDINQDKIQKLSKGIVPIHEPGLDRLIQKNHLESRLNFTSDIKEATKHAQIHFISVWTPPLEDGRADLSAVFKVGESISQNLAKNKKYIIVTKSTVPVGTGDDIRKVVKKNFSGKFEVVSNPEFLREGQAIADMMHPDRIVVGGNDKDAVEAVVSLYDKIKGERVLTNLQTAEMIKYAANAFLATKISFINEVANVCERVGANIDMVAKGIGMDRRIGHSFLRAGIGYGGSCFPKDVRALQQFANIRGYDFKLLKSVIEVNEQQKKLVVQKLKKHLKTLKNKKIMVLGLAFKSNTDDVRESAAIEIIKNLLKAGAKVRAYDPAALINAKKIIPEKVEYLSHPHNGIKDLDAIVIATEWSDFINLDWQKIKNKMKKPLIVDGRNLLDVGTLKRLGYIYEGVGR